MKSFLIPAMLATAFSSIVSALPSTTPRQVSVDYYFTLYDNPTCDLSSYRYWQGSGSTFCTPIPYSGIYFAKQALAPNCVINFYLDVECQMFYTDFTGEYPELDSCGHFEQLPYSFLVDCQ